MKILILALVALSCLGGAGYLYHEKAASNYVLLEEPSELSSIPLIIRMPPASEPSELAALEVSYKTLQPENTLSFNDVVTDESVAQFQQNLQEMDARLPKDQCIDLVLYTPGGSVPAGMGMIDSIKATGRCVNTLTIFAASMGFQVVQNVGRRMITPSGVLMNHRAQGAIEGEYGGEFDSRFDFTKREILFLDQIAADRIGMPLDAYRLQQRDEAWVHGFDAVQMGWADQVVYAKCSSKMSGKEDKLINTFFGPVIVTFSKCPLITGPLAIRMGNKATIEDERNATQFFRLLYTNPPAFVNQWIKTNRFREVLR